MNPKIQIALSPINEFINNNEEDFTKNTKQPLLYKVQVTEKELNLELTVAWLESGFKVVSSDLLILNSMSMLGGYVNFDKTGGIASFKDTTKIKTISIKNDLINRIKLKDKSVLTTLFDQILKDYKITINKIDTISFALFYVSDFKIENKALFDAVTKKCEEALKIKEIKF